MHDTKLCMYMYSEYFENSPWENAPHSLNAVEIVAHILSSKMVK